MSRFGGRRATGGRVPAEEIPAREEIGREGDTALRVIASEPQSAEM